jgi:hypothetical protein
MTSRAQETKRHEAFARLAQSSRQVAYILFAIAIALAIVPLWIGLKYKGEYFWVCFAAALPAVTVLAGAIWQLLHRPGRLSDVEAGRLFVLAMGGLIGLDLLVISVALAFKWWDTLAGGLEAWQGSEGWRIWVFVLLQIGGLAVMFVSLQLARTEERTNPLLRRLVYGYNAALTGLLLLAILGVANVLASAYLAPSYDWTTKSIYSLGSRSEGILKGLQKPTKIYVILPRGDNDTFRRVRALVDNCRAVSDKLQVEYLSPDLDLEKVTQLAQKYKFSDRDGILVVYGTEPNTDSQFIRRESLYATSRSFTRQREPNIFQGESELLTAISFLSEGKQKPVVYFTQENGELDITDNRSHELDQGAGALKQRLEQDNIAVKGLQFSTVEGLTSKNPDVVVSPRVPADASLVVIAGPRRPLPDYALKALRDYMNPTGPDADKKKGKLIVMLDVALNATKDKMVHTGVEDLLADFNVLVGENRVQHIGERFRNPLQVMAFANPDPDVRARNPLAAAFDSPFILYNVRTVQQQQGQGRPDSGRFQVDNLLLVPQADYIWAETDLRADPVQIVRDLRKPEHSKELIAKLSRDHLPIAVAVSERAPTADPHMMPQASDATPRMVVFGDATLACNLWMQGSDFGRVYDFFYSALGWLRERPSTIGIEPKKADVYEVASASVNFWRMVGLPAALMFVSIIALGTGVWVVRRR